MDSLWFSCRDHKKSTLTSGSKHSLLLVDQEVPVPWNTHINWCSCLSSTKFFVSEYKQHPCLCKWNRKYTYIPSARNARVRHRPQKPSWRVTSILMMNLWRPKRCCVSVRIQSFELPLCQLLSNCKRTVLSKSIVWISGAAMLTQWTEFTVFVWIKTSYSSSHTECEQSLCKTW